VVRGDTPAASTITANGAGTIATLGACFGTATLIV
jgi:hypothetical protein